MWSREPNFIRCRGDNLSEIADRYNVSMSDIKRWNKLRNNKAPLGRSLKIVTTERIAARTPKKANVDTIAVAVVNKSEKETNTSVTQVSAKESASPKVYKEEKVVTFKDVTKFHKVKKGDNLSEISDKYGVTMADIKKWNKLKNNNVALGKNLKIITNERVVTTVKKLVKQDNTAIAAAEKSKNESVDNEDKPSDFYIVKAGDNLSSIAKKYNVSVEDLKKWNDLPSNSIRLESKLKVADLTADNQEAQETVAKTEIKNVEYIVQNGENLGTIARKNGVTVSDLKMWNDLEDDNVQSGARIVVGKRIIADSSQQVVAEKSTTKKEKPPRPKMRSLLCSERRFAVQYRPQISRNYSVGYQKMERNPRQRTKARNEIEN
jgi:membrane-bound lytic murein transglycosylase D